MTWHGKISSPILLIHALHTHFLLPSSHISFLFWAAAMSSLSRLLGDRAPSLATLCFVLCLVRHCHQSLLVDTSSLHLMLNMQKLELGCILKSQCWVSGCVFVI